MKGVCLLAVVLLWSAAAQTRSQTVVDPQLRVRTLVTGLDTPTTMAFIGTNDILVLEKNSGQVRRVLDGVLESNPVLQVSVNIAGERGLLGIAVHPQFPATNWVYLCYSTDNTVPTNRIVRYEWNGTVLTNASLLAELPSFFSNHNGGVLGFGPDGKLYAVIGDQGLFGLFQNSNTNTPTEITSAIVRLNDDGTVPDDNPFFALGGVFTRVFAYGVRNSFGFGFDPVTGNLWDTENGPGTYDEINLVEPGFNSGWRNLMGPASRDAQGTNDLVVLDGSMYADPKFSWLSTVAPTAIMFLSSTNLGSQYENDAFVGEFNNGKLYHFEVNANRDGFVFQSPSLSDLVADTSGEFNEVSFGTGFGAISDIKVCPDGNLYVLSISAGTIFVIEPTGATVDLAAAWNDTGPKQTCKGTGPSLQCKLKGKLLVNATGSTDSPASVVRFYLSDDSTFDGGDTLLSGDVALAAIKAGKTKKVKLKATLVGASASGKYIIAILDGDGTVNETDEANNTIVFGPLP